MTANKVLILQFKRASKVISAGRGFVRHVQLVSLCLLVFGVAASAQQQFTLRSPIVVLDRERFYQESVFGQRQQRWLETESAALRNENRQIEMELTEEEQQLTELRNTVDRVTFQNMADAFNAKVERLRGGQDFKAQRLTQITEIAQSSFFDRAKPILFDLAQETGALVVLDKQSVIASADYIDITDIAIRRVDMQFDENSELFDTGLFPQDNDLTLRQQETENR